MGIVGILIALGLLIWLAYHGWSILLLAPATALLRPHWPATRCSRIGRELMASAAQFVVHFFPIFLLGAVSAS